MALTEVTFACAVKAEGAEHHGKRRGIMEWSPAHSMSAAMLQKAPITGICL